MEKHYLKPEACVGRIWDCSPLCASDLSGQANDYGSGNSAGNDISNTDIIEGGTF